MATPVTLVPDVPGGTMPSVPVTIVSGGVAPGAVASGAFASGSIAAGAMVDIIAVTGTKAAGTAAASSILAGGVFSSTIPAPTTGQQVAIQLDSSGAQRVSTEGGKASYRACGGPVMTANGVGLVLKGSASKTVRVTRVTVAMSLTTAAIVTAVVYRTTADATSGSNAAALTISKMDTGNASATAVATTYTTSTLGTGPSAVSQLIGLSSSATVNGSQMVFEYGTRNAQALTLRGTAEYAQLFISVSSFTGAATSMEIEWTEE